MARNANVTITHSTATDLSEPDSHSHYQTPSPSPSPSERVTRQVSFNIVFDQDVDDYDSVEITFDGDEAVYLTPEVIDSGTDRHAEVLQLTEANLALLESIFVQNFDRSSTASAISCPMSPAATYSMTFEEVHHEYMYNSLTECFEIVNHQVESLDSCHTLSPQNSDDLDVRWSGTLKPHNTRISLCNLTQLGGHGSHQQLSSTSNASAAKSRIQIRMRSSIQLGSNPSTSLLQTSFSTSSFPKASRDIEREVHIETAVSAVKDFKVFLEYDKERKSYDAVNIVTPKETFMIRFDHGVRNKAVVEEDVEEVVEEADAFIPQRRLSGRNSF